MHTPLSHQSTAKKYLRYGSLTLLALVMFGYSLYRASDLLFGIHLAVLGIKDGESVAAGTIDLSGSADHAIGVSIDGHPVSIDTAGAWQDTIALVPGYNSVRVSAADKFGRDVSSQFAVYYDAPAAQDLVVPTDASDPAATPPETLSMAKTRVTTD